MDDFGERHLLHHRQRRHRNDDTPMAAQSILSYRAPTCSLRRRWRWSMGIQERWREFVFCYYDRGRNSHNLDLCFDDNWEYRQCRSGDRKPMGQTCRLIERYLSNMAAGGP